MPQSEGHTQHPAEQHNYQHHSGRKADGRQDNSEDRQHSQAQQLPVPPAQDRAELITAEDVDMQIEQHIDDQTEPKGHSTPTSTRAAALPGGSYAPKQTEPKNHPNDQHTEPEEPQPTQPLYQYALFDSCASTNDLIAEAAGTAPTIFIAAENDPEIRQYVGARNKWNLDGEWFPKGSSHYRQLTDVDQLVDNKGAIIKQALAIAPNIPYIVVAGTPCQDLTTIGKLKGALGLAGTRSIYFYTFHLTLHYLQEALPPQKIMYVLENAASMKSEYRQTIQLVLGNSGRRPHLQERDSGLHTVAQRKRYYFTNSNHTCEPVPDAIPWCAPWTALEQITGNTKHKLLPIVRLQGQDRIRGLYRHSHIALHPYSLLYHTDTLPPSYLADCTSNNQLLQHAFWRRHLPEGAADTYCKYLTLELKSARNKQEEAELDKHTEELSHLFQNPCMHLPVRPLHYEAQQEPSTDNSRVLQPRQVQEHFATKILAPLRENPDTKQHLLKAWKTNDEQLRTLNPYRHLKLPRESSQMQQLPPEHSKPSIQYGNPDDHVALHRQAMQRNTAEEAYANHQLVPAVLSASVHDHLIATNSHDLLLALRATRYRTISKSNLLKQLIGSNIQPMIQDIPGMQAPEQLTSLVNALQWWAAQPPETTAVSPAQTVILVHIPAAAAPTLLHIGSKQPHSAYYVQQWAEQTAILVWHTACNKTVANTHHMPPSVKPHRAT